MVHRAPDSRLLTNLIDHEKEHAKHLAALFPLSHTALASLSAYAAASPSSQHTIAAVVGVLASADDALQRYARTLDTWREQLVALKDLEDDLTAVLRDRDILVTRLIKASKATRDAHRSSRLVSLSNFGSASFSSLPSTNSTVFTTSSSPASTNAKLAQAQAELQACEAHLVSKERELDARRITLACDGLGARCRALIDCGWIWGEMGKQGLRALQALGAGANANGHAAHKLSSIIPSTYASDNSSVTPSQSASQIAARSVETSQEGSASKEHERVRPRTAKPPVRSTRATEGGDLTITLPPAHAVSESALPTGVRAQPRPLENGDLTSSSSAGASTPNNQALPRRRRTRPVRSSLNIPEASDEGSDDVDTRSRIPSMVFPTKRASKTHDTSSDDDEPTGPLQVVDNDPFEVIRRSMLGPSAVAATPLLIATAPTARASAPDVRTSIIGESSPSKVAFPGSLSLSGHGHGGSIGMSTGSPPGAASSPGKRQRRPSMAFFGSLRGLFRKPKERERFEWDETPSPASPVQRAKTTGWVTRTDARIRGGGRQSSEDEVPRGTTHVPKVVHIGRRTSGARLRKGRPGASARENGPLRVPSQRDLDGWITDTSGAGAARSRTRRGTMKRKKISVANLRGSDQGHTDGEVDEAHSSLARLKASGASTSTLVIQIDRERRQVVSPGVSPDLDLGTQHRRAATTMAAPTRQPASEASPARRRSASLSLVDGEVMIISSSTSSHVTQNMSWRKPPPEVESIQPASPSPWSPSRSQSQRSPAQESQGSQSKQRRHLANGHAKHVQNQSLMSIVADVARQVPTEGGERGMLDRARSLDVPRAPGSVLRERAQEVVSAERGGDAGTSVNARGHARTASSPEDAGQVGQGQAPSQRAVKMPLKSALRNASRTPSPSPDPVGVVVVANKEAREARKEVEGDRGRSVVSPPWRDSASISSYETGRESLDVEALERASSPSPAPSPLRSPPVHTPVPRAQPHPSPARSQSLDLTVRSQTPPFTFPPPPVDPPPARAETSSNGTPGAHATDAQPVPRRKSVRVSLPPTFSPAPLTTREDSPESVDAPQGRKGVAGDVWADSSDEDEGYARARRLLSGQGRV